MPTISRKKRILILALGLAIFAAIAHSAYRSLRSLKNSTEESSERYALGSVLPENFSLETLDGKKSKLSAYGGKVILINFWAGWCAPCIAEMPGIYELQKRLRGKGFEVFAVNMDGNPEDGMKALLRFGEAPVSFFKGAGSDLAEQFAIGGLPFTVVVDRERKIRYARAGEVNWVQSETVSLIEGIL